MKDPIKVIFLDFDGVLNSSQFMTQEHEAGRLKGSSMMSELIDPKAVALVNEIIKKTGAVVVVSSTWRLGRIEIDPSKPINWETGENLRLKTPKDLEDILKRKGFEGEVIGLTPRLGGKERPQRGDEIQDWMDEYQEEVGPISAFVILDDDSDMVHLTSKLVQTHWETGLLPEHVPAVLQHLAS